MDKEYRLAATVEDIKQYINDAKIVAFDYETAPDEKFRGETKAALDPHRSHIVGCSFSVKAGTGIYAPIAHKTGENVNRDEFDIFLREFLSDTSIIKIAHNIAFESAQSYHRGIVIQPPVYDTFLASQMILNGDFRYRNISESGLKLLSSEILDENRETFEETVENRHFDEMNPSDEKTVSYACADSDDALRLYHIFNVWFDRYLPKHRWIVEEIESPTAVYLGIMKHNGVPLDITLMEERKKEALDEIKRLKNEILAITGTINIGANCSTKDFKKFLFEKENLPILSVTEKGQPAVDDAALITLKEWCVSNRPEMSGLFDRVQDYRKYGKIVSTYIDGYLKYINPVTGCIHPDFFTLSTETGRFNCQKPNCQNMSRKDNDPIGVRNFIKAPDGHLILSLDFSQIELRVGAFYCRDKIMLDTYKNNGDIHAATTSVIFGCSYEEAQNKHRDGYKEQRTIAKNVNFGTFYGLFPNGLQKTLKFKAGIEKNVDECAEIISSLKTGYPGLVGWQEETKAAAARNTYSETWLGRRRYLPDISNKDWKKRSFAERCSLNTPIQGSAADILKLAIVRILKGLTERPWLLPILQIHDELTFIIPEEKLDEAVAYVKSCMEEKPFPEFDIPLIAEALAGRTFGTMDEIDG